MRKRDRFRDACIEKPEGSKFDVVFTNNRNEPVKIFWVDRQGKRKPYGTLEAGWRKPYKTHPGAVWLITDANEKPLGHFVVGDRTAQAIVPAKKRISGDKSE